MERTNNAFRRLSRTVFAVIMVCTMIVGTGQVMVLADTVKKTVKAGDFTIDAYYDNGSSTAGSITIAGYNGTAKEIVLPVTVTIDGKVYPNSESGEGIYIGNSAFKGNTTITKVAVPKGIEMIAQSAFQGCSNLTEIAIDNSLEYIGPDAFADCPNLTTYRIGGTDIGKNIPCTLDPNSHNPKIGQKSDGTVYPNIVVYTVEGSPIDQYIQAVNAKSKANGGNLITLKYESNPYSNHTVKPETTSTTPSAGGNTGTTTPSTTPSAGTTTPSAGTTTPSTTPSAGTTTPSAGTITPSNNTIINNVIVNINTGTTTPSTGTTTPTSGSTTAADRTKRKGQDGTALGKGAAAEAAEAYLKGYSSENDPKGTSFGLLQMKSSAVKTNSFKLSWKKPAGAKSFALYGNKCGKKNKYVKQMVTKKTSVTIKKVNKKKLAKGTYYKFIVVALDASGNVIATSKTVHTATAGGKNAGNDKSVKTKAKKNKVSVKVTKTFKLGAKEVPASKKQKVKRHRKVAYESSNPKIATVSSTGVIKGIKKGSCYVYAYAQNGVFAKIKVTVKK